MATDQPSPHDAPAPRPEEPQAATDDDALILWMLSLTPTQRLEVAQGFVDSVQALRKGHRA
jgi:RecB family endonuclease NucS